MPFISFSCLIALAGSSSTMLNRSCESRHSCLVPNLKWKVFSLSLSVRYYLWVIRKCPLLGGGSSLLFKVCFLFCLVLSWRYVGPCSLLLIQFIYLSPFYRFFTYFFPLSSLWVGNQLCNQLYLASAKDSCFPDHHEVQTGICGTYIKASANESLQNSCPPTAGNILSFGRRTK